MYVGPGVAEASTLAFLGPRNMGRWLEESTARTPGRQQGGSRHSNQPSLFQEASPDCRIFTYIYLPPTEFEAAHKSTYSVMKALLTYPAGLSHWKQFTPFHSGRGVTLHMSSFSCS